MTNEDAQTPECGNTLAEYVAIERRLRQAIHDAYAALDAVTSKLGMDVTDQSLDLARALREAADRHRAVEDQAVRRWGLRKVRQVIRESHEREAFRTAADWKRSRGVAFGGLIWARKP